MKMEVHTFVQKFNTGLVPSSSQASADLPVSVVLEGEQEHQKQAFYLFESFARRNPMFYSAYEVMLYDEEIERASNNNVPKDNVILNSAKAYSTRQFESIFARVMDNIANNLLWRGQVTYCFFFSEAYADKYLVASFQQGFLWGLFGKYWHLGSLMRIRQWEKGHLSIRASGAWRIKIPRQLGGPRGFRRILKGLARIPSEPPFGDWFSRDQQLACLALNYITKKSDVYRPRIANNWGWDLDSFLGKNGTELYYFYRQMRQKWARALIREHIVCELNELLCQLGIQSKIIVQGWPTSEEILEAQKRLLNGTLSFNEAMERYWI